MLDEKIIADILQFLFEREHWMAVITLGLHILLSLELN